MNKLNNEQLDVAIEVGMVTVLMSLEGRLERLYQKINEEMDCGGICDTVYTLTWFATEFIDLHKDTDWEELHFNSNGQEQINPSDKFLYRSTSCKQRGGFEKTPLYVTCWDDAVEDYAEWKIETFNFEEFSKINHNRHAKNPLLL